MKKRSAKRLHLRRETLRRLEAIRPLQVGGGVSQDTTQPHTCCATETSLPLVGSGACETNSNRCESGRCA